MSPPKTMVIGLDAMDPSIALDLANRGRMPNLAGFLSRSTTSAVRNPEGLTVGGVWPSFATGCGPATHGLYCFRQFVSGRYEIRRFTPWDLQAPPFWDVLSREGRRCALIDVPLTAPSKTINGVQVVDWGTHDRMLAQTIVPSRDAALVLDTVRHPLSSRCDHSARAGRWRELLDQLVLGVDARVQVASALLDQEAWDLFVVVFSESHCAGHQFWSLHDPTNERHDPDLRAAVGVDPLAEVYSACDRGLGALLEKAGPNTHTVVLLSHGMGSHHDGDHLLSEILSRIEARRWPRPVMGRAREAALRIPQRLNRAWRRRRNALDPHVAGAVSVNGSRRFFQVPNNELIGAVRVNLVGREPRGVVQPGHEYDALLGELTSELLSLEDAERSGRRLVRRILRTDDVHRGPLRHMLPDLLIDWDRAAPITAARSDTIGIVRGAYVGSRSGDHRPTGLVAVAGPGIAEGLKSAEVRVEDIAPTVCAGLGIHLDGVDGTIAAPLARS